MCFNKRLTEPVYGHIFDHLRLTFVFSFSFSGIFADVRSYVFLIHTLSNPRKKHTKRQREFMGRAFTP